jgi:hypothetical protein
LRKASERSQQERETVISTAKQEYLERLAMVIRHLHNCDCTWVESVPVHEVFRGETIWQGTVEVFTLTGHPKAKRCYGWHHLSGPQDQDERFVTVLEIPPVTSPETAVKVAAAKEIRKARKQ